MFTAGQQNESDALRPGETGGADPLRRTAGKAAEFVIYPQAGHAFNADNRPNYVKSAADGGWKQALN